MSTARDEIRDAADQYGWDVLESPQAGELIYRQRGMLVFAQYDRDGKMRAAELRRVIGANLTTRIAGIGWTDGVKVWHVTKWLAEYGSPPPVRRRRRA